MGALEDVCAHPPLREVVLTRRLAKGSLSLERLKRAGGDPEPGMWTIVVYVPGASGDFTELYDTGHLGVHLNSWSQELRQSGVLLIALLRPSEVNDLDALRDLSWPVDLLEATLLRLGAEDLDRHRGRIRALRDGGSWTADARDEAALLRSLRTAEDLDRVLDEREERGIPGAEALARPEVSPLVLACAYVACFHRELSADGFQRLVFCCWRRVTS